jgi:hypothetical protein
MGLVCTMLARPRGDRIAHVICKVLRVACIVAIIVICILVFIELGISDAVEQVQGETKIPTVVFAVCVGIWLILSIFYWAAEWFAQTWDKENTSHNIGYFYMVMTVCILAVLIVQMAIGRGLFDVLTLIPMFYIPFIITVYCKYFVTLPIFLNHLSNLQSMKDASRKIQETSEKTIVKSN